MFHSPECHSCPVSSAFKTLSTEHNPEWITWPGVCQRSHYMIKAWTHLNVCLIVLVRRSMIFTRSSLEQVSSSVRSWFRSRDVTRPSSSSSFTMLSALKHALKLYTHKHRCLDHLGDLFCSEKVPALFLLAAEPPTLWLQSNTTPTNQKPTETIYWPDVPESNLLIKMSAHDTLLCAHNVITTWTSKHGLHTYTGETSSISLD